MHPLRIRYVIAGTVIIVAGVAIAITGAGVGEGALWKGIAVAVVGAALISTGLRLKAD